MKQIILILNFLFLAINYSIAQGTAALNHNGQTTIFSGNFSFVDAYGAASNGDTIYLSGGNFGFTGDFDKRLTVIGAGYHPNSSNATGITVISSTLYIGNYSDGAFFEGLTFQLQVIKSANVVADNLTFLRCKFNNVLDFGSSGIFNDSNYLSFIECVFLNTLNLRSTFNVLISNSILQSNILDLFHGTVNHSILLYNSVNGSVNTLNCHSVNGCTVKNSIIFNSLSDFGGPIILDSNVFSKSSISNGSAILINNYFNIYLPNFFVNQSGYQFNYLHDYHLTGNNSTTYLGNDNTQVGIYGGPFPFKEGGIPSNPHIQSKNIASQTNSNGTLQINISVQAQNE